jgi:hypothetical protein
MDPYTQAAFGFAQAYQMNMRAADEQRRANEPSTDAFIEELNDERSDLNYSPTPQAPAPPQEQYSGGDESNASILHTHEGSSAASRARQKVSKYLQDQR